MRGWIALLLAALGGCAVPPPEAYVGGTAHSAGQPLGLGRNASGEACTQQEQGSAAAAIFCGTWQQPSGHVSRGGPVQPDGLVELATASPWRSALDSRYTCGEPAAATILGSSPALVLACTRRNGGWPQVAMVASVEGTAYFADGIQPALPVLERSVGVLSGRVSAAAAPSVPPGQADALFASRLAAQSYGANDIGQYDELMVAGTRANLAESYVAAEQAFRAALTLQQKHLGDRDPNLAAPLMLLALQLSDQGRTAEADATFARAVRLGSGAADPVIPARLLHYRGLNAINEGRDADALPLLKAAEVRYTTLLPAELLATGAHPGPVPFTAAGRNVTAGASGQMLVLEPSQTAALIGVVEARRYQAIALRNLGRPDEADATIRSALTLASARGLSQRNLTARLYRTGATIQDLQGVQSLGGQDLNDQGLSGQGLSRMTLASLDFGASQPGTRPLAATELLRAGELQQQGHSADALPLCRRAVSLLMDLKVGTTADLMASCLDVYAASAERSPQNRQALLGEMFLAAQLVQGSITSQQIALASARLSAGAKDPRVGAAIRRQQDASAALAALEQQSDVQTAAGAAKSAPEMAKLAQEARATLADSDAALQAAAPRYGELVQQVVPAGDVLGVLRPGEAFASIVLTANGGWVFVLRDGEIAAARTGAGAGAIAGMVKRVRASIEPTAAGVPPFDTADAAQLYNDTLGRLQQRLEGTQALVVAPAKALLSLPFAILLTGAASPDNLQTAPWLVRRMSIAHVPAPANFVSLRRIAGTSRATRPWFGFGDFRPATLRQAENSFPRPACEDSAKLFAALPPLPFARRELDATRALLGAAPSDELEGAAYTVDRVEHVDLQNYRVLHFATHALLPTDLRCESEPAIVTSTPAGASDVSGGLLTTDRIVDLTLDADVVILSACNSGGPGSSDGGESLSGLARAFFYAGARSLFVTHWSVNDQAAALLVADSMRRLRAGDAGGVAGALRGAELLILDGAGKTMPAALAHPYYWAPFALIGEGQGRTQSASLSRG